MDVHLGDPLDPGEVDTLEQVLNRDGPRGLMKHEVERLILTIRVLRDVMKGQEEQRKRDIEYRKRFTR